MERYRAVLGVIRDDRTALRLLDELIESADRYFSRVVLMEHRLATGRLQLEGEELKALTEELDSSRTRAHESLISDLHIFNRFLVKHHGDALAGAGLEGGIFPRPELIHDRVAIADWVGALLCGIYAGRRR